MLWLANADNKSGDTSAGNTPNIIACAALLAATSAIIGTSPHATTKEANIILSTCVMGVPVALKNKFLMSLRPNAMI